MSAKPKTAASSGDPRLPPEIWLEILSRLPVKSVLISKSVCKSWYSLISCPNFISHHITNLHEENGNRLLLQHEDVDSDELSFTSHDESCMVFSEHGDHCPDQFLGQDFTIVGSCNGLICLSQFGWKPPINDVQIANFLVWNPVIRKIVEVPSLSYLSRNQHASHVGFGFDPSTNDYKVMCNVYNSASKSDVCQIFDLRKGVWRSTSPSVPSLIVQFPEAECYVNGSIHWSVSALNWSASRPFKGTDRVILSFSMSDESFGEIRMPDTEEFTQSSDADRIRTRCVTFGGLVHVIVYKIERDGHIVDVSESCSVWAMKEYGVTESWTKVYNIDLQSARVLPTTQLQPFHFILWGRDEILMVRRLVHYNQNLILYNTGSRESKRILSINNKRVHDLCRYKESLALM